MRCIFEEKRTVIIYRKDEKLRCSFPVGESFFNTTLGIEDFAGVALIHEFGKIGVKVVGISEEVLKAVEADDINVALALLKEEVHV